MIRSEVRTALRALAMLGLSACGDDAAPDADGGGALDALRDVQVSEPVRPGLCDREAASDGVRDAFCAGAPPSVRSLQGLQELLDMKPGLQGAEGSFGGARDVPIDPYTISRFVVALGYSTALSGQVVSPINPRVIVLGRDTIMAFQRGVQQIELASRTHDGKRFNFYLLTFEQACSAKPSGCSAGELFTPRVESDWTRVELRDDEDLQNAPQDCRQCHQRGRETPVLLMRELQSPWTHFFETLPDDPPQNPLPDVRGADLVRDYLGAKGDEPYAGIAADLLRRTAPLVLEGTVPSPQPLVFDAPAIEDERWPYGPDGFAAEALPSPTWERAYEAFKRGEQLAVPYFEPRPTDPRKQAALSDAYVRYRAGELSADELPDMGDIFPDDPQVRAFIGLQTEPDASPGEALIQACGSCHNDVLDQSLSRARFNIDLARLDPAEIRQAIERIERPRTAPGAMPPRDARQLDPQVRGRLLDYLRQTPRSDEFDEPLARAAEMGMAGAATRAEAL